MANGLLGKGKVKIAAYSTAAVFNGRTFFDHGNCSVFSPSFTEEEKSLANFRDAAGGKADSFKRIDTVSLAITMHEFRADNLALLTWGTTAAKNATAIVDEAGGNYNPGAFVPTKRVLDTTVAPVVKKGAATVNTADYVVSAGGITFITGTPATAGLVAGDDITIAYTPKAGDDVQALVSGAPEVSIFLEGINANTNRWSIGRFWRCKLGVLSELPMIGEDFASFQLTAEVLKDETVNGVGQSQFFELELAD